jgi:hypothetical protein
MGAVMGRYVVAGKPLYIETPLWGDEEPHLPSLSVDDGKRTDTGLTDARGNPIYRLPDPVGFHLPRSKPNGRDRETGLDAKHESGN